jgi:hypothetical protein
MLVNIIEMVHCRPNGGLLTRIENCRECEFCKYYNNSEQEPVKTIVCSYYDNVGMDVK